ncbi:MAG: ABC transporter permease subunit [Planctomycetota bacterium]|nr:ABC transporter permease subunit [Planctomycetota bacterium]
MNRTLLLAACIAFAIVGLAPVAFMFARVGGDGLDALFTERTLTLLGRTAMLGLGAASTALVIGVPFGWLTARTDVFGAPVWRALGILPLVLPPLILAMSWAPMTSLRGGLATTLLLGIATFPLVALFTARAAERIDGRREEAALMAGGLRGVVRMELPLLWPSAAAAATFAFVFSVNDFAVPDYVSSIGPKYNVYADEVFATWRSSTDSARAVAAALPLVLLTLLALIPALELRRRTPLAAFDGDFRSPSRLRLGVWRLPALAFVTGVLALSVFAPLGRLVFESGGGARGFSIANMQASFGRAIELGRVNLQSSILYAAAAAVLCIPLAIVLGSALGRNARASRIATYALVLPIVVPAILFGIGNIATWNRPATGALYDSGWMVVILYVGRFAPFAVLAFAAGRAMLDPRIEEAARMAGAGPLRRLFCIVTPSLWPAILGGATLVYVFSMRELDAAIFVPSANGTVLFRLYNAVHFGRDDFVAALALLVTFFVVLPGLVWSTFARKRLEVLP